MKNRNKPVQAASLLCVMSMFLATSSCTKQGTSTTQLHSWTKDVKSLASDKVDSRFWSNVRSSYSLADAHKQLGRFYQQQGKHREAIAEFIKAIKMKTNDASVYNYLAMSYDALKKFEYAEMAYRDAIALAPDQPYLFNNYGCSSLLQGDIDGAIALFEKAASLDRESRRIQNNLALAQLRENNNISLDKVNEETIQLASQYETKSKSTSSIELEAEGINGNMTASLATSQVKGIVEKEEPPLAIIEKNKESDKDALHKEFGNLQDDFEESTTNELLTDSTAEAAVTKDEKTEVAVSQAVEVEEDITIAQQAPAESVVQNSDEEVIPAETAPALVAQDAAQESTTSELLPDSTAEAAVTKDEKTEVAVSQAVEVEEDITIAQQAPAESVVQNSDEVIPAETAPALIAQDTTQEEKSSVASNDIERWFDGFLDSILATLGFESNMKTVDTDTSAESDQTTVAATKNELSDKEITARNMVEGQAWSTTGTIVNGPITENSIVANQSDNREELEKNVVSIPAQSVTISEEIIQFTSKSPSPEKAENKPIKFIERAVAKKVAASSVIAKNMNIGGTIDDNVVTAATIQTNDPAARIHQDVSSTTQKDEPPSSVDHLTSKKKSWSTDFNDQTPTGLEAQVHLKKAAIEVSNGNGVEGMATRSAAYFIGQGELIGRITNAKHFGFKESVVFYREGYLKEAYRFALMVPGQQEMIQVESLGRPGISIRLLLGKDLASLHFPEAMSGISHQKSSAGEQTVALLHK